MNLDLLESAAKTLIEEIEATGDVKTEDAKTRNKI